MKGEIDAARECYLVFDGLGNTVQKVSVTRCSYSICVLQLTGVVFSGAINLLLVFTSYQW